MGQYHVVVNLDKREFLDPYKLGDGLKMFEHLNSCGGVMAGLHVLLAASNGRGGGDVPNGITYVTPDEAKAKGFRITRKLAKQTVEAVYDEDLYSRAQNIGRWAGDRIAVVGDYAERDDLRKKDNADILFWLCGSEEHRARQVAHLRKRAAEEDDEKRRKVLAEKADRLEKTPLFRDVTEEIVPVVEYACSVKIDKTSDGWRDKKCRHKHEDSASAHADMVISKTV